MRQLLVLRHAKSSWDDPGLPDHDRPLAPRGRRAVKLLAAHLEAEGLRLDQVLCSSARRTIETLEGLDVDGEHLVEPELYGASAHEVLQRLHRVPGDVEALMVVGHNPAMQVLVLHLAAHGPALADVQRKFPTGALATLHFDCTWSELRPRCAALVEFVRPKALHQS